VSVWDVWCVCGGLGAPIKQGDEVGETRPISDGHLNRRGGPPLHKRNPDAVLRRVCLMDGGEEEEEGECG